MLHFRVKQYNLVLPTELIVHFGYRKEFLKWTFKRSSFVIRQSEWN